MQRVRAWIRLGVVVLAVVALAVSGGWAAAAEPGGAKLRGAALIDAAEYPDLQAALDALPAAGGLVRLPPGDFELTRPLVLTRENTRVEGAGAATHLINRNDQGQPAVILRPPNRDEDRRARIWRIQLADFRISGNPKSGDGLRAEGVNEIYVHGLAIDHNGGHGINLIDCYEDPRISDSIVTYNGLAGLNLVACHDIVVSANQFEENQDALRCTDSFNLCMTGNNLDDHLRHGVVIENTYGSVLSGNMIEECQGTAVILDRDCYGITVSANVIAHNFGGGVHLLDAWGCAVSANTFAIVDQGAVVVGPASGRIAITGNNFSNSFKGPDVKRDDAATGVVLEGASDVVISGNLFSGMAGQAVRADAACRRIVATGNLTVDLNRKTEEQLPALDLDEATEAVTADNLVVEEPAPKPPE